MIDFLREIWGGITDRLSNEPVLFLTVVQATLTLLVSFGLGLSTEQVGAILFVSASVLGLIARQKVTPA